jgi:Uma2 family endonuclease
MATKTLMTVGDLERLPDDGMRYELTEGKLITMPPPKPRHVIVSHNLYDSLSAATRERGLGRVFVEMPYLLSRDQHTLRVPDVSFLRSERARELRDDEYLDGAPDLAVEVVSPSETAVDLDEKIRQYLAGGAAIVWAVYPKTRTVHVYKADGTIQVVSEDGLLEAPDLLPGWSVRVGDCLS